MNVTFRQLKIFEAVARQLSFTRASQELHLTQPAVSMQIKQLEQVVGLALFEQVGKRVSLTDAGRELERYSRSITAQLLEVSQVFEDMKGLKHGRLNIAVASTANYFVPKLLASFRNRYPDITVSLDVTNREQLLHMLAENQTDLVIMGHAPPELDLTADNLLENPLVVIAAPGHALAKESLISLDRLQEETFLVREQGSGTRLAMEGWFAENDVVISTSMEMSSSEAIKQGVEAGLGLGLVSIHTLEMELALKRLVILKVEKFPIQRHWYIVHRKGKRLSLVARTFKDFVLAEAPKILKVPKESLG